MADTLFVSDDPEGPWHTATDTFSERSRRDALQGRSMTVVLPGQNVRAIPHELPDLRPRERMEAARFLVEPLLGQGVDQLHLVIGESHISAVGRSYLRSVLDELGEAGVTPTAMFADHELLPPATLPDRVVLDTATLDIGFPLADMPPPDMDYAEALHRADATLANNLLVGEFAPRRSLLPGVDSALLKAAAGLALALGVGFGTLQYAEARAESLQVEDLRARAQQLYIRGTGETSANPARDLAALASAPPTVSATDLMAVLFSALQTTPGIRVDSLRYSEATRQLDLRLVYPGLSSSDELAAAVSRAGGRLEARGVRETGGRLLGDATLELVN